MFIKSKRLIKLHKIVVALMVVLAMTAPMTAFAEGEDDNFSTLELSNKINDEGKLVKKVAGETDSTGDNNTNLKVTLSESNDEVVLYRIADVEYTSGRYSIDWTEKVKDWLEESTFTSEIYKSPVSFIPAEQKLKDEFYKALLYPRNDTNIVADTVDEAKKLTPVEVVANSLDSEAKAGKITVESGTATNGKHFLYYRKVPFGLYAVIATNNDKNFNPTVVEIYPDQASPNGSYYIKNEIVASVKDSQATIEKTINGKSSATVYMGESVEFEIEVVLPTLYKDRDESVTPYTLSVEDVYSKAFENIRNLKVSYTFNGNTTDGTNTDKKYTEEFLKNADKTNHEFDGVDVNYNTFIKPASFSSLSSGEQAAWTKIEEDGLLEEVTYSETSDVATGWYYKEVTAPIYVLNTEVAGHPTIELNVQALKAFTKQKKADSDYKAKGFEGIHSIIISYDATISEEIEINSENNTNTANLEYEINIDGTTDTISSVARAYTYGLNLIKLDGNSTDNAEPTPLENAFFTMYREVCTFDVTDSGNVTVFSRYNDRDAENYDYATLKLDSQYYFTPVVIKNVEENGSQVEKSFTTMYKLVTNGRVRKPDGTYAALGTESNKRGWFKSEADLKGIVLEGLAPGNYIVHEEQAPLGYNRLAEDMLIQIVALTDSEADEHYSGSKAGFYDSDDSNKQYIAGGIFELKVLNYAGLVLPTTGGMGTMLFTVLGTFMMSVVIVILVIKRKPIDYDKYIM